MSKKRKGPRRTKGKKPRNSAARRLSVCVIARDEARFLDACLASVGGLADEVIVVDTGSTDDSKEVARRRGARVFDEQWQDDFSHARNRALREARGEWILVLDCDEVVAHSDHAALRALLRDEAHGAYRMTTRNYSTAVQHEGWTACTGAYAEEKAYGGWFPSTKVRLWRHRSDVQFEGVVHELVEPALLRAQVSIGDCLVPVHHYGYAEKERDKDHYLQAGERKVRDNPSDIRARYELAIAYRNAGRHQDALVSIDAALSGLMAADNRSLIYVQEDLVLLVRADILTRLGRFDDALIAYDKLLERFPQSHQAFNNKGILLERAGRMGDARLCYERAVAIAPENQIARENFERLSQRRTLSACIIARDEAAHIGRCLESACAVADQVVVVDTGSRDTTIDIARRYGVTLGHFTWCDDFAAARNASLELATGDWILWLDADDYLLPADREKIIRAKSLVPDVGLYATLVNEGGEETRFRQLKMFPNRPDIRFEQPVHESVLGALRRAGLELRPTDIQVCHTRESDAGEIARKQAYYADIMGRWLCDHPSDWETQFRFGHVLYTRGERQGALEYFERVRAAGDAAGAASLRLLASSFAGRCLLEEGRYDEARAVLADALSLRADDALSLLSMGDVSVKKGDYVEAERYVRAALAGWRDPHFSLDVKAFDYAAHFFLGQALSGQGRNDDAIRVFEQAEQIAPARSEARQAIALLRQGIGQGDKGLYVRRETQVDVAVSAEPEAVYPDSKLSLCMIVRDEEERLGRCLESVRGLVDEIVVVDTGSQDGTVEVAKRFGAQVSYFSWCDDFAAARNASLQQASGDWIMWLDADDIMPAECHDAIRRRVAGARDKAYFFVLDDQGYENVSCLQMRLFPNRPGVQFEMPVHEQVAPSLTRLGIDMVQSEIRVMHTGYTTPEVVAGKKDRYLKIMERWLEAHPDDYMERSHVALTYYSTGRLEEAERAYRYIIEESSCYADCNWVVYTTALLFLGRTYMKMDRLDAALEYAQKAEEMDRSYILTQLTLAEIGAQRGDHAAVIERARTVAASDRQMTFFPIDYEEINYSAHLLRARSHQALEQWDEAIAAYRSAASTSASRRGDALGSLFNLYRQLGRPDDARATLEEALAMRPDHAEHLFNLGVLDLEARQFDAARARFEEALTRQPNFALALLNLGYIAKVQGRLDDAESIYQRAASGDEEGVEARANLAHLYLEQERFADAEPLFARVHVQQSDLLDIELGYLLTLVHTPERNWPACVELLNGVRSLVGDWTVVEGDFATPEQAALRVGELGALLLRNKMNKCAELALSVAVELDDTVLDVRRLLAEVLFAEGLYWKAVAQLEVVLTVEPGDEQSFRRLGDCYAQLGVNEAAQMCYARSGVTSEV